MEREIKQKIEEILAPFQLNWGVAQLKMPLSFFLYEDWLNQGYEGDMTYLSRHKRAKESPKLLSQTARSAIVILQPYWPHPDTKDLPLKSEGIASYARGGDYHFWLIEKLNEIISELKRIFPNETFSAFTDSQPVLERDLAYRASLGWIGKNTCLIDRKKGSFFLIGEIFTSLDLTNSEPLQFDHCGKCTACIEACPTQAISKDGRHLDSKKCISYWTIESKQAPPEHLRIHFSGQLFGCDICQTVCPWNKKSLISNKNSNSIEEDIQWILSHSDAEIKSQLRETALSRTKPKKMKMNALIAIQNLKLHHLKSLVEKARSESDLAEISDWVLRHI